MLARVPRLKSAERRLSRGMSGPLTPALFLRSADVRELLITSPESIVAAAYAVPVTRISDERQVGDHRLVAGSAVALLSGKRFSPRRGAASCGKALLNRT